MAARWDKEEACDEDGTPIEFFSMTLQAGDPGMHLTVSQPEKHARWEAALDVSPSDVPGAGKEAIVFEFGEYETKREAKVAAERKTLTLLEQMRRKLRGAPARSPKRGRRLKRS